MQNIGQSFTSNEKKIILQISHEMSESYTRLGDKGHPIIDRAKEEYEATDFEVADCIIDRILGVEVLKENPEHLTRMNRLDLLIAKSIILEILPKENLTIAKRNLLRKINYILSLHDLNQN